MPISPPLELLELVPGGRLVTRVLRWEEGRVTIHPARAPQGVEVDVLRLHVPPEDKPTAPAYWDVTASTAIASLRGLLPGISRSEGWLSITKHGVAPRARFSVVALPADPRRRALAEVAGPMPGSP